VPLYYANVIHKMMSLYFVNAFDGKRIELPFMSNLYAPLGTIHRNELGSHAWIVVSYGVRTGKRAGKQKPCIAPALSSIPDGDLFDCLPGLVDTIRRLPATVAMKSPVEAMLRELVMDSRIGDDDKLLMLTASTVMPLLPALAPALAPALSCNLLEGLKMALGLEKKWFDLDAVIDEHTTMLTDALYEPDDIALLHSERSRMMLELETELLRLEEERIKQEQAEQARKAEEERKRKEREEALRSALTLGRNRTDPDDFTMTNEFQHIFELVENGEKLLFITGKPGTGKSTLIRALRSNLSHLNLVVLSYTGTAALNIGGQTINSFFMMPFNVLELGWTCTKYSFKARAQALEVLIIDEVSMLRPDMLDAMDSALRSSRRDNRPFGGVQVLLVGDLHQLPPIIDSDEAVQGYYQDTYANIRWFFAAKVFAERPIKVVELSRVFRQKAGDFLDFLSEVRDAAVAGDRIDWFNRAVRREPDFPQTVFYLIVTPHRNTASHYNHVRLDELPGESKSWMARIDEHGTSRNPDEGETKYPADRVLVLKPGAQVMMIKNDEGKNWVNGDLGIVEQVHDDTIRVTTGSGTWNVERVRWPMIKYELDQKTHRLVPIEYASYVQFPIRLAWAATIHKMQGQTVDRIKIDLTGGAFESGMTYVALSRCRTMEGIRLTRSILQSDLICDASIVEYLASLEHI